MGPAAEAVKRYGVKTVNPELIEALVDVDKTKMKGERKILGLTLGEGGAFQKPSSCAA